MISAAVCKHGALPVRGDSVVPAGVECKTANTLDELGQARELVLRTYIRKGYVQDGGLNQDRANAYRDAQTFVAKRGDSVVMTVTLVPDSPLGLPMDEIYGAEMDLLRHQRRVLAEASAFAGHECLGSQGMSCYLALARQLYFHARGAGVDDLCIAVNPRHSAFYERVLLFEDLGDTDPRPYPRVSNHPACGKRLNVRAFEERVKRTNIRIYRFFFGAWGWMEEAAAVGM